MTVPRDLLPLGFLSVEFLWAPEQQVKIFFVLVHTAELDSTVCIIWQSRIPWCASYSGVGFHCVHHTAESDSTVCIIRRSRIPRCAGHRRVTVKSFTAESELLCMRYVSGVRLLCWQTTRRVRTLLCMRYFSGVRLLCRQTT